ncbi:MAG: DNA polymerase III subunit beta [Bacteroidales bacterium]|nr:DNA polymerase III subunit beta [Candidatus Scybalousia scybalohippi]
MKFIVHGGTLARSLNAIGNLPGKNNTIPIVEYFLLSLEENNLVITATDLETMASVSIELQDFDDMGKSKVCVPAKEFSVFINQATSAPLTIMVNEDYSVDIVSNNGRYNFQGKEPDDFPQMIQIEDADKFTITSSALVNGISKTLFAVSQDEFRPQMSGVLFEFSSKGLTFVGTDSHKLVRMRNTNFATEDERAFILPKKTLNVLQKILSSINEDLEVRVENNVSNIAFYFENFHIACRLIEGKYPQYEAAIPTNNPNKLIVSAGALMSTIKRIQIFANTATNQIKLSLADKRLIITAEDVNYGTKGKEELSCDYEGDAMDIGLNSKYLTEIINNIETENICFEFSKPDRPCIVLPFEEEAKEDNSEDLLMLLMPVVLVGE